MRVLVADDQSDSADHLIAHLSAAGFDTHLAQDTKQIQTQAALCRPQVCVIDLAILGVHGWEAVRLIKEESWASQTLFIAVTGWPEPGQRSDPYATFDFYVRPGEPQEIVRIIRAHFSAASTLGEP
ncbi:MAG: response regulator [Gammaproteobacteria bacterium]